MALDLRSSVWDGYHAHLLSGVKECRVRRFVVVVSVLCLGVFASSASARRGAHGAEKRNVERAVFHQDLPPLACDDVWTSSVSRFWAVDYYQPSGHASCGHWATGKRTFLEHVPGGWRVVARRSGLSCPNPARTSGVPDSIERDLLGCPAAAPKPTPTPTPTPTPAGCSPLTNAGNCYEPGEYCRNSDHGVSGVAGDGEAITCEDNNGWRWEPT
jgi:hypothetical protein